MADGYLDKVEFMLLALDRKTIFSQENITALFNYWDNEGQGIISIQESLHSMFNHSSDANEKLRKFYYCLEN